MQHAVAGKPFRVVRIPVGDGSLEILHNLSQARMSYAARLARSRVSLSGGRMLADSSVSVGCAWPWPFIGAESPCMRG
jgi:hypothetical protein